MLLQSFEKRQGRTQRSAPTNAGLPDVIRNIRPYTTTRYAIL